MITSTDITEIRQHLNRASSRLVYFISDSATPPQVTMALRNTIDRLEEAYDALITVQNLVKPK